MNHDTQIALVIGLCLAALTALIGGFATYGAKQGNDAIIACIKAGSPARDCKEAFRP